MLTEGEVFRVPGFFPSVYARISSAEKQGQQIKVVSLGLFSRATSVKSTVADDDDNMMTTT